MRSIPAIKIIVWSYEEMGDVNLSPKDLLRSDGSFVLQHSDFADLSAYIEAVLSSYLDNDTTEAFARLSSQTIQFQTGPIKVASPDWLLNILDRKKISVLTYTGE